MINELRNKKQLVRFGIFTVVKMLVFLFVMLFGLQQRNCVSVEYTASIFSISFLKMEVVCFFEMLVSANRKQLSIPHKCGDTLHPLNLSLRLRQRKKRIPSHDIWQEQKFK
jgi:hypothetical protein